MRLRSLARRRPSASIVISSTALFLSLGGVGYAAAGQIGTNDIKNNAVTFRKIRPNSVGRVRLADRGVIHSKLARGAVSFANIQPGSVGVRRANLNQLQARVKTTCAAGTGMTAIDSKGNATCTPSLPAEFGTTPNIAALTDAATTLASKALPAGATYLAFANPEMAATSTDAVAHLSVTCTLTVGSNTVTRAAEMRTDGTAGDVTTAAIPLQLAGTSGTASVVCTAAAAKGSTLPKLTADSAINALQTSSSN